MITWESICKAVEPMQTVNIKGKEYATVPERVKAFRSICPGGCISTEIVKLDESMVVMKATISDEKGDTLSTGLAYEMKDSSYINKTSYIENCETSAVGRALGWIALGVDASMCSAEELVNALRAQNAPSQPAEARTGKYTPVKPEAVTAPETAAKTTVEAVDVNRRVFILKNWANTYHIPMQKVGDYIQSLHKGGAITSTEWRTMPEADFSNLLHALDANYGGDPA